MQTTSHDDIQEVYETQVVITNDQGLHARPAAILAQKAQSFASEITITGSGMTIDAKSILDILSLAATKGTTLTIRGQGPDARLAVTCLAKQIRTQFKEEAL